MANLGPARGAETGGIQKAIILQNNTGNYYSRTTIVAMISKQSGQITQIRTIDKQRLIKYIDRIDNMSQVDGTLAVIFGLTDSRT